MAVRVNSLGFTALHNPTFPELDIVFVHGLQGHPRRTWTYSDGKDEHLDVNDAQTGAIKTLKRLFKRRSRNAATPTGSTPSYAGAGGTRPDIFWPEDLLPNLEACKQARILTYGYDSRLFDLVKKVNFSEISSQGETFLNGLARVRADYNNRPLMFIAHSLGGLLVKIALNESRKKSTNPTAKDKYDIVNSTFAVIFFGTPHRGASIADLGLKIIRVAAAATHMSYNPSIIKTLDQNSETLKGLRKDFIDTLDYMITRNNFESSTFQENQGLSNVPGFKGKVVEDDSSELERNDRNDHIEADHMGMCRFSGSDDPGFAVFSGETGSICQLAHVQRRDTDRGYTGMAFYCQGHV
ncbi:hypothetical protein F5X68DRAFT_226540 [Plectosphaerella plurivora]|uniref:DUF676 domain-containing protein n=1 Tax=Plectosphaerella plurivora TaxID=936078 RepID=A0A9P8VMG5_9PEZI|nr:hypothetical protein F5X68DRAFT_226540 [Plectosphaerella plurivora]